MPDVNYEREFGSINTRIEILQDRINKNEHDTSNKLRDITSKIDKIDDKLLEQNDKLIQQNEKLVEKINSKIDATHTESLAEIRKVKEKADKIENDKHFLLGINKAIAVLFAMLVVIIPIALKVMGKI